jgi:predicted amidophosphoribosyltransferase
MLSKILNLIAPVNCQVCGDRGVLCCQSHFPASVPSRDELAGLTGYFAHELDDQLHRVISGFKDRSITALAGDLAELAKPLTRTEPWQRADLVMHPPSSRVAYRKRGFVPTQLILRRLKQPLPIASFTLLRQPKEQRSLNAQQRNENILGAFHCKPLNGASVALFDDVMTTSATIQEMARAVTEAGGNVTGFCVIARRLLDFDPRTSNQA